MTASTFAVGQRVWRDTIGCGLDAKPVSGIVLAVVDDEKTGRHYVVRWWVWSRSRYDVALIGPVEAEFPHIIRATRAAPGGA